jgi:hypothetical protein
VSIETHHAAGYKLGGRSRVRRHLGPEIELLTRFGSFIESSSP